MRKIKKKSFDSLAAPLMKAAISAVFGLVALQSRGQDNDWQMRVNRLAGDTLRLSKELAEIKKSIGDIEERINAVDERDYDAVRDEIASFNALKPQLLAKVDSLSDIVQKKEHELGVVKTYLNDWYRYYDDMLGRKLSNISGDELEELEATVDIFVEMGMPGMDIYKSRIRSVRDDVQLYEQTYAVLHSPFDNDEFYRVIGRLRSRLGVKTDDLQYGVFKFTDEQFNEMDSIDICMARYPNGIGQLRALIDRVNNDPAVMDCRERHDAAGCREAICRIIKADDEETTKVRERYCGHVPYLGYLLQEYEDCVWRDPLATPNRAEKLIDELITK